MHRNQHPGRRPQFIGLPVPFNPDTGGFLRRAAAALLLLACALALLLSDDGDVVQAQAPPLVSNTEQGSDESAGYSTSDHGQAFTTGYNATGYTVGGVIIISEDEEGDDTALKICGVGSNDSPTTTCTNLTAPSSFARGLLVFNAPTGTTLTLASRTTYMVVFNSPGGQTVDVGATTSGDEDSASLPYWSIRDLFQWNDGGTWKNGSRGRAIRIDIQGTANPASATAPTASDGTVTATEETAYAFTAADFSFSATTDGDTLASVQILTLPARGTLALSGTAVTVNQSVTKAQLDAGNLTYTPAADGYGSGYASFLFRVSGSTEASTLAYTMTIDVTGTQDVATGTPTISGTAQVRYTLTASTAGIADPDGLPGTFTYQWKRYAANGTTFEANIGANSMTYTLTASEEGKKVKVEVSFTDNGGSSEGPLASAAYPASGTVGAGPLVINTGQGRDSSATYSTSDHGQAFTTGHNATGYTVTGVTIISEDEQGDDTALKICGVASNGGPTTTCTNLTAPSSFARGLLVFNAPTGTTLALEDETTYMVVFNSPGGEPVDVDATTSDDEDSASLPDWSIRDMFQWNDGGTWKNGGRSRAIRIAIRGTVNPASATAPTASDGTVTATEETAYAFAAADFNFTAGTGGDALASVRVLTLPADGTLALSGTAVTVNQSVTKAQLDAGNLTYTPPADGYGSGYASFLFKMSDSAAASTSAYTMTIDVTGTQDAATGAPTFSGSPKVGLALKAITTAIRDPDGLGSFSYQWIRVDADGTSSPTGIGENSNRYLLTEEDFGKRIKVRVDFTDGIGGAESRTSDAYPSDGTVQHIDIVLVPRTWAGAPRSNNEPIFRVGQQYRLMVITNRNLVSTVDDSDNRKDGAFYNGKVADGVGANTILAPHKDGFTALVSTTGDSSASPPVPAAIARDNTETTGTGVPIYWFTGSRVADDYADFYDGSWDSRASRNQDGVILGGNDACAWTGSRSSGTPSHRPLGSRDYITRGCNAGSGQEIDLDVIDTANGGTGIYALSPVFRVSIPPTSSNGTVTTNEDTDHAFAAANFSYSPGEIGDPLASVKITGLPADGTLSLDGTAIAPTDLPVTVTTADLTASKLKYSPPANANGTAYASFRFRVNDGALDSDFDYTMTINVTAVNDPATGTPTINGTALVGQTLTASIADIADADGLPSAFTYQWKRYAANGTTFEANIGVNSSTYTLTVSEQGKKVLAEVSFTDNGGGSEGPLVSPAYPASGTVGAGPTDATLSALTVSPKDIIGFVADRTSYEVGVASTVTQATITATKSHSAATVAYSSTDADTSAGHQVNLSDGRNEVTITVTAEDTTTTGTYTVSINRGVTDAFGWKASDDFDGLITAENNRPRGMWSDGTTMWVTDWIDIKIYAYDMTTKAHDASKDFDTLDAAGNDNPRGIWSDGTTVWVSDYSDEKLYAYDMTTKAHDVSKDFDTANLLPTGIWSDGTTMWVAAQVPTKIYAYDMSTKARDADKDFDTLEAAGNNYPGGIWSNNITMWVAEEDDEKLYAYNMASKARDADKDFNTLNAAGNGETGGIWANTNTNTMWASDTIDYKIYSYNMPLIAPNIPAAGTPAVTAPNVFRVPAVLSADLTGITDTDGVTGIASNATYKWQRFAANGTTLDTDSVGTGSTYTLTDADAGKTLKVVVSFTDNGGNSEGPLTSAATSAITAAAICAAPTLTGGATFLGPARKIEVGRISFIGSLMYGYSKASGKGSLDNARFTTAASNNYEIVVITNSSSILVEFDTALTADDRSTLVVHICDQAYAFSSSDSFIQHEFTTPLQNWAPHAERTIYLSQDTAAPTFASATVNGTSLVITLSEDLGAAGSLANSAFTVKKNGSTTALTLGATAPVISGSTVTLTLAAASSVTATDTNVLVTYTKPGTGTANKLVDAFGNETGTFADQVVTNLLSTTVPDAPTALTATASGTTQINLSWSAPASDGGAPITGYKIEVSSNGTSGWTDLVANTSNTTTTYAHTGLTAGSTRHYRVSAINANGAGTASNVDSATTATTVPGAPTGLTATASGTTQINLSWTAPASTGGSAITGYKIESSSDGGSSWSDLVANTGNANTTYAHTGLGGGTTRHYRVSAINTNGAGTASNVDSATTGTTAPGAPTGLTATASGTTQINLSWSAPASTGGSAITGYKIESSSDGGSSWSDLVANTGNANTTYAHTGLGGGTTRHYRVSAINANGAGTASNVDSATTGTTAPGAPTGLTATASGTTQINLSWSAPASTGGSAITGYKIESSSDGGSSWSDLVADTGNANTTYQHTGLTASSTRHYRVSAINTNGSGTASNVDSATTGTTGTTVPGAPTSFSATASGQNQIDLSWSAPASGGGAPITGYRIEVSSDGGSSWTNLVANTGNANTTYAHTGLGAGDTRHYRVSAINANGAGTASNVDSATTGTTVPGAPTGLTATASGTTQIDLSWTAPGSTGGSAITGYKIEVSSDGGSSWTDHVANTSSTTTTYAHSGLGGGTTRHYRVSAINTNGAGTASNTDSATTAAAGETTVTFTGSSYTASEGQGEKAITVELSAPPSARVRIPLAVTHLGGATAADYSGPPSSVTFVAGRTRFTFGVEATDDSHADAGESVRIGFGTLPDGYAPGERPTATVTLEDNDNADLIVNFGTERHTTVKVLESDTVWHRFTFSLSTSRYGPPNGNPQQPVTIPLVVTHRGGATPADYEVRGRRTLTSVTFGVGESVTSFSMRAIPDGRRETGEGLRLDFGRLPAGVSQGDWGPYETIAFVDQELPRYTVLFGAEAYTATEGGAPARVSIHLNEPVEIEPLVVRLRVTHVGATAADYTGIPDVVRFGVGEQTQTITVRATDDTDDDDGESVTLSFVNDPNDRVSTGNTPSTATVALADNDGPRRVTVSFGAATYTATEGGADATVRVELDVAPGRSVTVPLTKAHLGNATAADYSGIPMNVTFAANQTSRTFAVMATADQIADGGESVSIGFGTLPEGVFAGSPAATTVTLADGGEQRLVANFGSSRGHTVQVREGARRLRLNVLLNSSPRRPVTIPLVVTHVGGATAADYADIPESVTFAAGQTSSHYYMRALPDLMIETGEGLRIDFGPLPPGVTKGTWGPYETIEFVDP